MQSSWWPLSLKTGVGVGEEAVGAPIGNLNHGAEEGCTRQPTELDRPGGLLAPHVTSLSLSFLHM